jgi:hypothetical protein
VQGTTDFALSTEEIVPSEIAAEFEIAIRRSPFEILSESRESGPSASLELLAIPAVALWVAKRYFGAMIDEVGKDHYQHVKAALLRLVRRTTGPDREIVLTALASERSPHKVSDRHPAVLSIFASTTSGQSVKFIFEHHIGPEFQESALTALCLMMHDHYLSLADDELGRQIATANATRSHMVVLRYSVAEQCWKAVDMRGFGA